MTRVEEQILKNQEIIMEALYALIPDYNSTESKNLNHYCWVTNKILKAEREADPHQHTLKEIFG